MTTRGRRSALVGALWLALGLAAGADPASKPVAPEELTDSIDEVLSRPEFAWRLGLDLDKPESEAWPIKFFSQLADWVETGFDHLRRWWRDLERWLDSHEPDAPSGIFAGGPLSARMTLVVLAAVALAVGAFLVLRRRRGREEAQVAVAAPIELATLAEDASAAADVAPSHWLEWARELEREGRRREAVRALYLAMLSGLAGFGLLRLDRAKSNRDYHRELGRRARDRPALMVACQDTMSAYERTWFGRDEASTELVQEVAATLDRVLEVQGA